MCHGNIIGCDVQGHVTPRDVKIVRYAWMAKEKSVAEVQQQCNRQNPQLSITDIHNLN